MGRGPRRWRSGWAAPAVFETLLFPACGGGGPPTGSEPAASAEPVGASAQTASPQRAESPSNEPPTRAPQLIRAPWIELHSGLGGPRTEGGVRLHMQAHADAHHPVARAWHVPIARIFSRLRACYQASAPASHVPPGHRLRWRITFASDGTFERLAVHGQAPLFDGLLPCLERVFGRMRLPPRLAGRPLSVVQDLRFVVRDSNPPSLRVDESDRPLPPDGRPIDPSGHPHDEAP